MTKHLRKAALVLALGLLSACNGDSSSPTEPRANPFTSPSTSVPSPQTFELSPGETTTPEGGQTEVTFVRVLSDNRCPIEAICRQMGGVEVEIQVRQPSGTSTHVVRYDAGNTPQQQPAVAGSWAITADKVLPAMTSLRVIQLQEYRVTFTATPR